MSFPLGELLPKIKSLSYLFTESEGTTVAHCLELDLVATGRDRETAERRLGTLIKAQLKMMVSRFNFADLNFAAPQEYFDRFYEGQEFKKTHLELDVPPIIFEIEQKFSVPVFMRAIAA